MSGHEETDDTGHCSVGRNLRSKELNRHDAGSNGGVRGASQKTHEADGRKGRQVETGNSGVKGPGGGPDEKYRRYNPATPPKLNVLAVNMLFTKNAYHETG